MTVPASTPAPGLLLTYQPHPKQTALHTSAANEILFGGAAGPGKSCCLRAEAVFWCARVPGIQVYLFRRTFPELEKNHVLPSMLELNQTYFTWNDQKKRWTCANGSMIHFCHCQHETDVFGYQGADTPSADRRVDAVHTVPVRLPARSRALHAERPGAIPPQNPRSGMRVEPRRCGAPMGQIALADVLRARR